MVDSLKAYTGQTVYRVERPYRAGHSVNAVECRVDEKQVFAELLPKQDRRKGGDRRQSAASLRGDCRAQYEMRSVRGRRSSDKGFAHLSIEV